MPRESVREWIEFTDFSPGIFSNNNLAGGVNVTSLNPAYAQETDTWGCRSLPTGGLGPLPRRKYTKRLTTIPDTGNSITYTVCGLGTWGFVFGSSSANTDTNHREEVHVLVSYNKTNGANFDHKAAWIREHIYDTVPSTEIITAVQSLAVATAQTPYRYAYFLKTRMNPTTVTDPGHPVMACIWTNANQTLTINQAQPNPLTPTTGSVLTVINATDTLRRAVAHQGRIVAGKQTSYARGLNTTMTTDENVIYTAVNSNVIVTTTPAVYVPETDQTITDWASMSANQLVVVKRMGGGYVLQGDLDDVTVVRLPNLKSSDGTPTVAGTNTSIGWVYSGGDAGLFLWNGGEAASPISSQLDGQAFTETTSIDRFGHVGSCDRWGNFILAPRGWVYDLSSDDPGRRGWWKIESTDQPDALTHPIVFWSAATYEGQAIGAARFFTDASPNFFFIYEYDDLAYRWSWKSHPLWISQNRFMEVREGVIALQGYGTVTVTLTDQAGASSAHAIDVASDDIQNYRWNIACNPESLVVKIAAEGHIGAAGAATSEAPLVHRMFLAYQSDSHLPLDT